MKMIPDNTGRFIHRPYFENGEIDFECERIIDEILRQRKKAKFTPPLDTDTLTVLIESYADDLDIYADLENEGTGIEAITVFRHNEKPRVQLDKRLTAPNMINRFRSTLAHELFHVKFHRWLYELQWSQCSLFDSSKNSARCHRQSIVGAGKVDWLEWQAAYGGGAFLMPETFVRGECERFSRGVSRLPYPIGSQEAQGMVKSIATLFEVSEDAANVRLRQLKLVKGSQAQTRIF